MPEYLFQRGQLHNFLNQKLEELRREVLSWGRDYLLNTGEAQFRYVLHQPNDKNREVWLTVCLFDISS
jgi:hypothetical protein